MWLLVGLGNPGDKYARNRHNIGFMAVDALASSHNFPAFKKKFQGVMSEGRIGTHKVILLKPQTFMNLSGQSVGEAAKFYKIPPAQIIVFHDELDLQAGKLRVKTGGGHAGHNGLKSTDSHLGSKDYIRVRMGIGHPGDKDRVTGYVLGDFAKDDRDWVEAMCDGIARHIPLLLDGNENDFMSKVASAIPAPKNAPTKDNVQA